ncbi:MAG: hypothetical protein P1U32_03000 [Legionellaceae bacterium]|nr:hypothetical protein [Legionellaceae bacterium]
MPSFNHAGHYTPAQPTTGENTLIAQHETLETEARALRVRADKKKAEAAKPLSRRGLAAPSSHTTSRWTPLLAASGPV